MHAEELIASKQRLRAAKALFAIAVLAAAMSIFTISAFAADELAGKDAESVQLAAANTETPADTASAANAEADALTTAAKETKLSGTEHVENIGTTEKSAVEVGKDLELGSTGKALRLEEIKLDVDSDVEGSIVYEAHVQDIGWQGEKTDGQAAGTEGEAKRIEAVTINLTGDLATTYDIWYQAHVENIGWMGWTKNGKKAGSSAQSLRLEALRIRMLLKGAAAPGSTNNPYSAPTLVSNAHVQDIGWTGSTGDAEIIGTTGRGLHLEALTLALGEGAPATGTITYSAHVQDYGWMDPVSNGAVAGTTGEGKRIEALKASLSGSIASNYKLYYSAHVANIGWLGWTTDNQIAGTTDSAIRVEAFRMMLVKNTDAAPTSAAPAYLAPSMVTANISTWSNGSSSWTTVNAGEVAGTEGQARALLGMKLDQTTSWDGKVNYQTHLSGIGWTDPSSEGGQSGTLDGNNRVEGICIWLDGAINNYFDVYYRVHLSDYGWMGWAENGGLAGTSGLGRSIEAFQVVFTVKGGKAPGSTQNSFSNEFGFLGDPVRGEMNALAQGYSSPTGMLMMVDNVYCKVGVYTGSQGNWSLAQYWDCANGRDDSPTVRGVYHVGSKGYSFGDDDHTCFYWSQISGNYLFHSVLYQPYQSSPRGDNVKFDGLGGHYSNGCVRLATDNAYWVYANVPSGTTIVSYH